MLPHQDCLLKIDNSYFLCVSVYYSHEQTFTFVPISRDRKNIVIDVKNAFCKFRPELMQGIKDKKLAIVGTFKYRLSEKEMLEIIKYEILFSRNVVQKQKV